MAGDAKVRSPGETPCNMICLPYSRRFTPVRTVLARTSTDAEQTALTLLTAGRELDPDLWVFDTKTMERHLALMRLPPRLSAFVLSAFGPLAVDGVHILSFRGVPPTSEMVPLKSFSTSRLNDSNVPSESDEFRLYPSRNWW